jgi:hypothetical protein
MPPAKSRSAHDDSKPDAKDKDKSHSGGPQQSNGKVRRQANQTNNGRGEPPTVATAEKSAAGAGQDPVTVSLVGASSFSMTMQVETLTCRLQVQWSAIDRDILHKYRREHRLATPKAFCSSYHHYVFNQVGGVGQYSPTMNRRKTQRRQTKEQVATAVRKHFNSMGVSENDIIADLLFSVRHKGAMPPRSKPEDAQPGEGER